MFCDRVTPSLNGAWRLPRACILIDEDFSLVITLEAISRLNGDLFLTDAASIGLEILEFSTHYE